MAKKYNMKYLETSVQDNIGVKEMFESTTEMIVQGLIDKNNAKIDLIAVDEVKKGTITSFTPIPKRQLT
jgi:hypothetical protein